MQYKNKRFCRTSLSAAQDLEVVLRQACLPDRITHVFRTGFPAKQELSILVRQASLQVEQAGYYIEDDS